MGITFKGEVPTFGDLPAGAVQGDLYVVADPVPAHGWVWDEVAAAWVDAGPVQGPQGIQGPQGVAGVQGPAGVDGAAGPAGPSAVSVDAGNTSRLGSDGLIFTPAGTYTLPVATAAVLGGVKIGSGVTVAADGTISVAAASGSYLPLAGGTMTGTIVAPTAVNAITFGTSTYGILGGTGGVSVRNGATNLMLATAANVAYAVPLQTQNSATALQFGSGGPTLGKGTNGIQASAAIDCATAPTVGTHLTNKTYVDSKVPVNAVAGSKAGLTLWTGTQAEYDAIAAKDANTVYVVS